MCHADFVERYISLLAPKGALCNQLTRRIYKHWVPTGLFASTRPCELGVDCGFSGDRMGSLICVGQAQQSRFAPVRPH